jgi:hypothetical protein
MGHSTTIMTMRYAHLATHGGREYLAALEAGAAFGATAAG